MGFIARKSDFVVCEQQGTDQHVHQHSLISTLVICCSYKTVTLGICKISIFQLVSVAEQTGLRLTCSETPKTGVLMWQPNVKWWLVRQ